MPWTQGSGQCWQDDNREAAEWRGHHHHQPNARVQHQNAAVQRVSWQHRGLSHLPKAAQLQPWPWGNQQLQRWQPSSFVALPACGQVQAQHLGRGWPEDVAALLAQLLREDRRPHMGALGGGLSSLRPCLPGSTFTVRLQHIYMQHS